jgi:uncharacterized membrane protein YdbT with pleckstrin-like domain
MLEPGERITCAFRVHWCAYIPALAFVGLLMTPGPITGLVTTRLALTNKRVLAQAGFFRQKTLTLPHKDIETVKVRQGFIGMLFDYGDLILTGHNQRIRLRGIAEPFDALIQINEANELATLGRKLSQTPLAKW